MSDLFDRAIALLTFLMFVACTTAVLAAWVIHIVACISGAMWGFLIAGAVLFPIGVAHGIYLWLF